MLNHGSQHSNEHEEEMWIKRVLVFSCLVSRAIHLEAIEELSTSSYINALRRFMTLKGQVIQFRSDRETNFIVAVHEPNIPFDLIDDPL